MSSLTATAHPDIAAVDIVLNINTILDTFTRTTSNGWGSADTGEAWTASGGLAADYSTSGTVGQLSLGSVNVDRRVLMASVSLLDVDIRGTVLNTVAPATAGIEIGILARWQDTSNYADARLFLAVGGAVTCAVRQVVGGVETFAGFPTVAGATATTSTSWRLQAAGTVLRFKAWATTVAEPQAWTVSMTTSWLTAGQVGMRAKLNTGNTNVLPVVIQWDNYRVGEIDDLWHVSRVYPDGTAAELLGSPVYTSDGYAVMWDTVQPLDVPIYYTAGSDLSTVVLTSNIITVTGTGTGWLKDPAEPVNDIPFSTCPTSVCPLDVDNDDTSVSFLRLGQATFPSASGVFPIIDGARSRTVAQTRKARDSSLAVLSHTLEAGARVEDILASGRNLFLQLAARYGWAYRNWAADYITVQDVAEERPPSANMTRPHRAFGLPFLLARPPFVPTGLVAGNGIGVNGATYGDATATGRTYAQRTATGNTYLMSSRGENL